MVDAKKELTVSDIAQIVANARTQYNVSVNENPDSLEIGKAGERVKVYGDFSNPEDFKKRILNSVRLVNDARALLAQADENKNGA